MDESVVIAWIIEHKEIITLLAVVAAGIGALYRPFRDLLEIMPKLIWTILKYISLIIWFVMWPIRKPIAWLYAKYLSDHVYNILERIFEWFEEREAAKEERRNDSRTIKPTEL
jgi:hypothetical protein